MSRGTGTGICRTSRWAKGEAARGCGNPEVDHYDYRGWLRYFNHLNIGLWGAHRPSLQLTLRSVLNVSAFVEAPVEPKQPEPPIVGGRWVRTISKVL